MFGDLLVQVALGHGFQDTDVLVDGLVAGGGQQIQALAQFPDVALLAGRLDPLVQVSLAGGADDSLGVGDHGRKRFHHRLHGGHHAGLVSLPGDHRHIQVPLRDALGDFSGHSGLTAHLVADDPGHEDAQQDRGAESDDDHRDNQETDTGRCFLAQGEVVLGRGVAELHDLLEGGFGGAIGGCHVGEDVLDPVGVLALGEEFEALLHVRFVRAPGLVEFGPQLFLLLRHGRALGLLDLVDELPHVLVVLVHLLDVLLPQLRIIADHEIVQAPHVLERLVVGGTHIPHRRELPGVHVAVQGFQAIDAGEADEADAKRDGRHQGKGQGQLSGETKFFEPVHDRLLITSRNVFRLIRWCRGRPRLKPFHPRRVRGSR